MENEMTGYILTLLENYAKTTKEIELLRYELGAVKIYAQNYLQAPAE